MQSRVAIGSTRVAIGYAREAGRDRVRSNGIGYGSGSDRVRSYGDRLDLDLGSSRNRFDRVSIEQWSNLGRADRVLVGKYFNPDLGRSLHDRYSTDPIPTRLILDSFSIASRAVCCTLSTRIFLICQKLTKGRPKTTVHTTPAYQARSTPDRMIGFDRVDLIGSVNPS